jgi:hypothetical protein
MKRRVCNALIVSAVVFLLDPLSASTNVASRQTPWPELLYVDPIPVDSNVAALQQRANAALDRLLTQSQAPG